MEVRSKGGNILLGYLVEGHAKQRLQEQKLQAGACLPRPCKDKKEKVVGTPGTRDKEVKVISKR